MLFFKSSNSMPQRISQDIGFCKICENQYDKSKDENFCENCINNNFNEDPGYFRKKIAKNKIDNIEQPELLDIVPKNIRINSTESFHQIEHNANDDITSSVEGAKAAFKQVEQSIKKIANKYKIKDENVGEILNYIVPDKIDRYVVGNIDDVVEKYTLEFLNKYADLNFKNDSMAERNFIKVQKKKYFEDTIRINNNELKEALDTYGIYDEEITEENKEYLIDRLKKENALMDINDCLIGGIKKVSEPDNNKLDFLLNLSSLKEQSKEKEEYKIVKEAFEEFETSSNKKNISKLEDDNSLINNNFLTYSKAEEIIPDINDIENSFIRRVKYGNDSIRKISEKNAKKIDFDLLFQKNKENQKNSDNFLKKANLDDKMLNFNENKIKKINDFSNDDLREINNDKIEHYAYNNNFEKIEKEKEPLYILQFLDKNYKTNEINIYKLSNDYYSSDKNVIWKFNSLLNFKNYISNSDNFLKWASIHKVGSGFNVGDFIKDRHTFNVWIVVDRNNKNGDIYIRNAVSNQVLKVPLKDQKELIHVAEDLKNYIIKVAEGEAVNQYFSSDAKDKNKIFVGKEKEQFLPKTKYEHNQNYREEIPEIEDNDRLKGLDRVPIEDLTWEPKQVELKEKIKEKDPKSYNDIIETQYYPSRGGAPKIPVKQPSIKNPRNFGVIPDKSSPKNIPWNNRMIGTISNLKWLNMRKEAAKLEKKCTACKSQMKNQNNFWLSSYNDNLIKLCSFCYSKLNDFSKLLKNAQVETLEDQSDIQSESNLNTKKIEENANQMYRYFLNLKNDGYTDEEIRQEVSRVLKNKKLGDLSDEILDELFNKFERGEEPPEIETKEDRMKNKENQHEKIDLLGLIKEIIFQNKDKIKSFWQEISKEGLNQTEKAEKLYDYLFNEDFVLNTHSYGRMGISDVRLNDFLKYAAPILEELITTEDETEINNFLNEEEILELLQPEVTLDRIKSFIKDYLSGLSKEEKINKLKQFIIVQLKMTKTDKPEVKKFLKNKNLEEILNSVVHTLIKKYGNEENSNKEEIEDEKEEDLNKEETEDKKEEENEDFDVEDIIEEHVPTFDLESELDNEEKEEQEIEIPIEEIMRFE